MLVTCNVNSCRYNCDKKCSCKSLVIDGLECKSKENKNRMEFVTALTKALSEIRKEERSGVKK